MKVYQIGGESFDANIYLIMAKKPILVDTGTGLYNNKTIRKIKEITGKPTLINTIILTHRHFDHVGGAQGLKEALNATLYIYRDDAKPLIEEDQITTGARDFGGKLEKLDLEILNDDSIIDCGDIKLQVIHTPGHTIGSIVLYEPMSKSLFSSDTVFTDGGVGRWDLGTGNYDQLQQSLIKLSKMDIINLYPGHGPYSEGKGNYHIRLGLKNMKFMAGL